MREVHAAPPVLLTMRHRRRDASEMHLSSNVRDDAGGLHRFYPGDAVRLDLFNRVSIASWLFPIWGVSCALMILGALIHYFAISAVPRVITGTVGVPFVVLMFAMARRAKVRPSLVQTRLALGRCGACEHALPIVPPDASAMVTCTECGARWRPWPVTSRSPEEEFEHQLGLHGRHPPEDFLGRAAQPDAILPPKATAVVREIDREKAHNQNAGCIIELITLALCVGVMMMGYGLSILTLVVMFLICGILVPIYTQRRAWRFEIRRRLLASSLCADCGGELAATAGDLLASCTTCRRTWPTAEVGHDPIPPDPCPKCGTERAGPARCAGCDGRGAGITGVGKPTPHCARCDWELPGDDRVCPHCGVDCGTVYR